MSALLLNADAIRLLSIEPATKFLGQINELITNPLLHKLIAQMLGERKSCRHSKWMVTDRNPL